MGIELTFRELIHSLTDYDAYMEMYEDFQTLLSIKSNAYLKTTENLPSYKGMLGTSFNSSLLIITRAKLL